MDITLIMMLQNQVENNGKLLGDWDSVKSCVYARTLARYLI